MAVGRCGLTGVVCKELKVVDEPVERAAVGQSLQL